MVFLKIKLKDENNQQKVQFTKTNQTKQRSNKTTLKQNKTEDKAQLGESSKYPLVLYG